MPLRTRIKMVEKKVEKSSQNLPVLLKVISLRPLIPIKNSINGGSIEVEPNNADPKIGA
jgi:hypothetical protein